MERKAECSVTCGRLWGEADDGRAGPPPSSGLSHTQRSSAGHVIRGVKLEFSPEVLSPSADLFLFLPPEKHSM